MDLVPTVETLIAEHGVAAVLDAVGGAAAATTTPTRFASTATFGFAEGPHAPTLKQRPDDLPPRFEDLGPLGAGGMGEVRRVRDRQLGRIAALKLIRADLARKPSVVTRFLEEAQVSAQLQHPNIPPIYDVGFAPDGRCWFTMKEVRGRTLSEVIREVHDASADGTWRAGPSGASLHRLIDAFVRVCDAVGYAHARGVVHRDLKPDNVMIGAFGECLVLDWGLAKVVGRAEPAGDEPEVATTRSADHLGRTRTGGLLGTLAYMSPEQARGEVDTLDARSDVHALGALLYAVLFGSAPYQGPDAHSVLQQVLTGPPPALTSPGEAVPRGPKPPEELVAVCTRCMARDRSDRPADGAAVAAEARAWLEGAAKRAQAVALVAEAAEQAVEQSRLLGMAEVLRREAAERLAGVAAWEPEERKAAGWELEDEALALQREARLLEVRAEGLLYGALGHDAAAPEAHAALTRRFLELHAAAEAARDAETAAKMEVRLRGQADQLPPGHPLAAEVATWLRGDGSLTLVTDPPGAEVWLYRYELRRRRLVPVPVGSLGRTPLRAVPLPMGSYLCVLRHPDRVDVAYPVAIGRGEPWHGVGPGDREPRPVRLPAPEELGPDDVPIPAGWFRSGGDADAVDGLPGRRLWCDDLVMRRFPVTVGEYLTFLDALVASGREALADAAQPRERAAGDGSPVFGRDAAGRFVLRPDADGDLWDPDWPVFLVDFLGASAYAAWLAEQTGQPWRLAGELEWEKAARGTDGRLYPWGDRFDASWCAMRESQAYPRPARVDSFPVDESPYGVRGLAGNVYTWCGDTYAAEGPAVVGDAVIPPRPVPLPQLFAEREASVPLRASRGGDWGAPARSTRSAGRRRGGPQLRLEYLGIRLVRSW